MVRACWQGLTRVLKRKWGRRTSGVLLVEDEEPIRGVLADLLQEAGYRVWTVPDGRRALERVRAHPEGLVVLLDLLRPGLDGAALLQAVAAEAPLRRQYAYIFLSTTAKTLPLQVLQLLKHMQAAVLPKPVDLDAVLAAVHQAASGLSTQQRADARRSGET